MKRLRVPRRAPTLVAPIVVALLVLIGLFSRTQMGSSLAGSEGSDGPKLRLVILTQRRVESFSRLLKSIRDSESLTGVTQVDIFVDGWRDRHSSETLAALHSTVAEFERSVAPIPVEMHVRLQQDGLRMSWWSAFYPVRDDEYAWVLEDDLQISPFGIPLTMHVLRTLHDRARDDPDLLKMMLLCSHRVVMTEGVSTRLSAWPAFCRWGPVLAPRHWREFQHWLRDKYVETCFVPYTPGVPEVNHFWFSGSDEPESMAWRYIYERGLFSIAIEGLGLSINHMEVGENYPVPQTPVMDLITTAEQAEQFRMAVDEQLRISDLTYRDGTFDLRDRDYAYKEMMVPKSVPTPEADFIHQVNEEVKDNFEWYTGERPKPEPTGEEEEGNEGQFREQTREPAYFCLENPMVLPGEEVERAAWLPTLTSARVADRTHHLGTETRSSVAVLVVGQLRPPGRNFGANNPPECTFDSAIENIVRKYEAELLTVSSYGPGFTDVEARKHGAVANADAYVLYDTGPFDDIVARIASFAGYEVPDWTKYFAWAGPWVGPYGPEGAGLSLRIAWYLGALLLLHVENGRARPYDWAVMIRPDYCWSAPAPPIADLEPDVVHIPDVDHWGGLFDRMLVLPRSAILDTLKAPMEDLLQQTKLLEYLYSLDLPTVNFNSEIFLKLTLRRYGHRVKLFPPFGFLQPDPPEELETAQRIAKELLNKSWADILREESVEVDMDRIWDEPVEKGQ